HAILPAPGRLALDGHCGQVWPRAYALDDAGKGAAPVRAIGRPPRRVAGLEELAASAAGNESPTMADRQPHDPPPPPQPDLHGQELLRGSGQVPGGYAATTQQPTSNSPTQRAHYYYHE